MPAEQLTSTSPTPILAVSGSGNGPVPDAPPRDLAYRHRINVGESLRQLWRSRGLLRSLTERELRIRYKQAHLGAAWAVLSPAALMVVFSVLINRGVVSVATGGKPAYLFSYVGLIPWTFFSAAIVSGSTSMITNLYLVNRIYCPREVFPLTSVVVAAVDASVASVLFLALFPVAGITPASTSVWVPVLLLVEMVFTVGVSLLLSVTLVYFRDLRHVLPIVVQFGLFATPVLWMLNPPPGSRRISLAIPHHLLATYSFLDPLGPVIDGIRRCMLFGQAPQWGYVADAAVTSVALLVVGFLLFRKLEPGIADIA